MGHALMGVILLGCGWRCSVVVQAQVSHTHGTGLLARPSTTQDSVERAARLFGPGCQVTIAHRCLRSGQDGESMSLE